MHERQPEYESINISNNNDNNINNNINIINNYDRFDYNKYKYNDYNRKDNIWAEPNFNINNNQHRQTLGSLLMNGLPPISTKHLFH